MQAGDIVCKSGSGYRFPGILLRTYETNDGKAMAVVESIFHPGMQHIFPVTILYRWPGTFADLLENHITYVKEKHSDRTRSL